MKGLRGPVPFDPAAHDTSGFDCGDLTLNSWLRDRAGKNMSGGGSFTWVVVDGQSRVSGFYAAATGAAIHAEISGRARRNQPDPIPAVVLGRLAVDTRHQGVGLGAALLKHFLTKVLEIAAVIGVRLVVVHAKNERAAQFYAGYGFSASPVDEMALHLLVEDLRQSLT